jgi:mono/diheme cytochrome c family protein
MRFLATIMSLTMILILLSACGGSGQAASSGQNAQNGGETNGQALFTSNCSACHGPTGAGLPGLGKPLTTSEFVGSLSDEELLAFIKTGRPADDPLNTSGVLMPPKGGNPALTDEQLQAVIAYIRSIRTD